MVISLSSVCLFIKSGRHLLIIFTQGQGQPHLPRSGFFLGYSWAVNDWEPRESPKIPCCRKPHVVAPSRASLLDPSTTWSGGWPSHVGVKYAPQRQTSGAFASCLDMHVRTASDLRWHASYPQNNMTHTEADGRLRQELALENGNRGCDKSEKLSASILLCLPRQYTPSTNFYPAIGLLKRIIIGR